MKKIVRREYVIPQENPLGHFHPVLQRVYAARNIQSIRQVDNSIKQLLPYQSLRGIDAAINILAEALMLNERILIVGDFDADGATSTAVAVRALRSFGCDQVSYLVPNRFAYGYGLTPELVEAAKEYSPDVIVTVDNGIANHAGVEAAKQAGIKVVVTDHHLPSATAPDADAIVNPNQHGCEFPSKSLAGVGVIFYVMLALHRHLANQGWFESKGIEAPNMSRLLDIVTLGTVADLVPLDQNNRIIIHHGLRRIRAGQCVPGIVALLELANRDFKRAVTADLGFAVAARLNAAGRLDDMSLGIECLLTDDAFKAREIARQLDELNHERRSIEKDMQQHAIKVLDKLAEKLESNLPTGLCLFHDSWHQGVIGILASRIKDKYHRPVIIFAPGQDDEMKGSARSITGFHLRDALALLDARQPGLMKKFGGHAMAAGLTIMRKDLDAFTVAFQSVTDELISEAQLQETLLTDGELSSDEYTLDLAETLREAGPWGQAFPEPLFDGVFKLIEQRIVGERHLKLTLMKDNKTIDAIAFFVDLEAWPNHRCQQARVVYRMDVNEYRSRKQVQLIIDYLEAL